MYKLYSDIIASCLILNALNTNQNYFQDTNIDCAIYMNNVYIIMGGCCIVMYRNKFNLIIVFSLLFLSLIGNTRATPQTQVGLTTCGKPTMNIQISNAYYGDNDLDGFQDDVYVETKIEILCTNRVNFQYYISLTLPSGQSFTYGYMVNTNLNTLTFDNNFYDHAIESGDYVVDIYIVLKTGGVSFSGDSRTFDPPGGSNTEPYFHLSWY